MQPTRFNEDSFRSPFVLRLPLPTEDSDNGWEAKMETRTYDMEANADAEVDADGKRAGRYFLLVLQRRTRLSPVYVKSSNQLKCTGAGGFHENADSTGLTLIQRRRYHYSSAASAPERVVS